MESNIISVLEVYNLKNKQKNSKLILLKTADSSDEINLSARTLFPIKQII